MVEFDEGEKLSISAPKHSAEAKIYRLAGPPGTHFEIVLRPAPFQYNCFDESVRIFDEASRVDFLTGICGMFDTKPVTSCANNVAIEFLSLFSDNQLEIDIKNTKTVSLRQILNNSDQKCFKRNPGLFIHSHVGKSPKFHIRSGAIWREQIGLLAGPRPSLIHGPGWSILTA